MRQGEHSEQVTGCWFVRIRCRDFGGPTVGCCSTYLGPRGVTRGDQGGGALLHQIREIGVAREQISVAEETVAGG